MRNYHLRSRWNLKAFFFFSILAFTVSCNEREKKNGLPSETNEVISLESEEITDTTDIVGLEDIPYTMQEDWVYYKNPSPQLKSLTSLAYEPMKATITAGIWDFEAETFQALMDSLTKDVKSVGADLTYALKENDTIVATTSYSDGGNFKWIGKYYRKDQKMRLIAIGAMEQNYKANLDTIKKVYNSIQVGK